MRKRVAFFTEPAWAFGSIHSALCKELYPFGIDADIIDWRKSYTFEEFKDFIDIYDVFVTTPNTSVAVLVNQYRVPSQKIIAIAHGIQDVAIGLSLNIDFNSFLGFATISKVVLNYARQYGIKRDIKLVRNGIQFDRFYRPVKDKLENLGYAGALAHYNVDEKTDCKRRHLALKLSAITGLPLIPHSFISFERMPLYYAKTSSIVVPSDSSEACGLPLMESAAAGRLPISAKIGILSEFNSPPGLILPLDEPAFLSEGTERIRELTADPIKYKSMCKEAQDFAREYYDWKFVIEDWAALFLKMGPVE